MSNVLLVGRSGTGNISSSCKNESRPFAPDVESYQQFLCYEIHDSALGVET